MFTGIVELTARIHAFYDRNSSETMSQFVIEVDDSLPVSELKHGQSIAINGCCLTLLPIDAEFPGQLRFDVSSETLERSNLGLLKPGSLVNLERAMRLSDRLDGHMVSGHIDAVAQVCQFTVEGGGWIFSIEFEDRFKNLVIEKGSICINGVSLTINNIEALPKIGRVQIHTMLIPTTVEFSNLGQLAVGDWVNVEFDLVGKYVLRARL